MITLHDFYQITLWSVLIKLLVIIVIYSLHGVIGKIFFPSNSFFIQAFIGSSFSAAITSSLCALNAISARYFVYFNLFSILILNLYKAINHFRIKMRDKESFLLQYIVGYKSLLIFFLSNFILLIFIFQESLKTVDGTVTVNSHQAYFSGVPLEILQADYGGRLRILDNYPLEYPRFHFFRGAAIANLLPVIKNGNFFDYQLANICIVAGLITLIYESLRMSYTKIGYTPLFFGLLFSFTLLANQFQWMMLTNNFPSVALIICIFILTRKYLDRQLIFSLLLILSCTTSRNFFPSFLMILVLLLSAFKVKRKMTDIKKILVEALSIFQRNKIFYVFVFIFVFTFFTMIGTGSSLFGLLHPKTWIARPVENLLPMEWLSLMSPSIAPVNIQIRDSMLTSFKPLPIYFFLFTLLALMFLLIAKYSIFSHKSLQHDFKYKIIFLLNLPLFIIAILLYFNDMQELLWILCYFVIPTCVVIGLLTGIRQRIFLGFIAASLGQFFIFIAGASVPNWILIEWVMVAIIIEKISELSRVFRGALFFIFLIPMLLIPSSFLRPDLIFAQNPLDTQTHNIDLTSYSNIFKSDNLSLYCRGSNEEGLLWSLKGVRSTYNPIESHNYTVTADFGRFDSQAAEFINLQCIKLN